MQSFCPKTSAGDNLVSSSGPTLAQIMQQYGDNYCRTHPLLRSHRSVIRAISTCRTAAQGGHLYQCDTCGYEHPVYNSCGNRHCPQCQYMAQNKWLSARIEELLPVPYFHTVFTLPHQLNPLARCNKKIIYSILFSSVAKTLLQFGSNPANKLNGKIGFYTILHTWDQKLLEHIHLHCVIPAGALSPDGSRWIHPKHSTYLFPVKALSQVFRGIFIHQLKISFAQCQLIFSGQSRTNTSHHQFHSLINDLYQTDWIVYSKKPFPGTSAVLAYLSRYTHKIALSNHRIISLANNTVTFSYQDRKHGNIRKTLTLPVNQFISRFLLHVLPHSFMRIRHYGFLATRNRHQHIAHAKELLKPLIPVTNTPPPPSSQSLPSLNSTPQPNCPRCNQGFMITVKKLPKYADPLISTFPLPQKVFDSS